MVFRYEYENGVWVDLERPTEEEIRDVGKEFDIPERLQTELVSPTPTPRVASGIDSVLLVLHLPAPGALDGVIEHQEVDFIVGKGYIVTAHYDVVTPLYELKKQLETQDLVSTATLSTEMLLEVLFAHFYTAVRDAANYASQNIARVESAMFNDRERHTIRLISNISREFLHMEAVLVGHEQILSNFFDALIRLSVFSKTFTERAERTLGERTQVTRLVSTYRAVATELRETNSALLEARQNQIMKTLTVVNIILLPLGLITWIFTMRTEGMPLVDRPDAFWIVLGILGSVALLMTLFFARKRWLL